MSLNIALRCDASAAIGTGHLMRCLTLAEALRPLGHRCTFIARDLPGARPDQITARGFALALLPAPDAAFAPDPAPTAHENWAGVPWPRDAAETRRVLQTAAFDWLILDHYAFDARWQDAALPPGLRLAVIDDLADRAHRCDLLLDQNLGRKAADYDGLIPATAARLIGPDHALLRPEFAALRDAALARRSTAAGALRHILIAMGGVDQPAMSLALLRALARLPLPAGAAIDVVMGGAAPSLSQVQAQAAKMPLPCRVHVDTPDMATLMAGADLAIGGTGGTAWERCSLGLPSLLVVMADNQAAGAQALAQAGAGILLGTAAASDLPERLRAALQTLSQPAALQALSARAAAITSGQGTAHLLARLCTPALHLRPVTLDDGPLIWQWRNSLSDTKALKSGQNPPLPDHLIWLAAALQSPARRLYMACTDHARGHLRLDDGPAPHTATVSLLLAPDARGQGLGRRILALAEGEARRLGLHTLLAEIGLDNTASQRAFTAAGYQPGPAQAGFVTLTLLL